MKKVVVILVCAILCVALTSCGDANVLALDEYDVYENESATLTASEFADGTFTIQSGDNTTTKRGIQIGSTKKELEEAYKGVASVEGSPDGMLTYETYFADGKSYDSDKFIKFLNDNGISSTVELLVKPTDFSKQHDTKWLRLTFFISDDTVSGIMISDEIARSLASSK